MVYAVVRDCETVSWWAIIRRKKHGRRTSVHMFVFTPIHRFKLNKPTSYTATSNCAYLLSRKSMTSETSHSVFYILFKVLWQNSFSFVLRLNITNISCILDPKGKQNILTLLMSVDIEYVIRAIKQKYNSLTQASKMLHALTLRTVDFVDLCMLCRNPQNACKRGIIRRKFFKTVLWLS